MFSASALSLDMGVARPRYESLDQGASERSPVTLGNAQWQLGLKPGVGLKAEVVHTPSAVVLAEGNCSYSIGTPSLGEAQESHDGPI